MNPPRIPAIMLLTVALSAAPGRADDAMLDRPGSSPFAGATLVAAEVGDRIDLSVREADGRESLGFDLGPARSPWLVLGASNGEVWARGGVGTFGWRRGPDGPFRAIEFDDADGRLIRRLPDAFFERLPEPLKAQWAADQASLPPPDPAAGPFRVAPTRPIDEIRAEAIRARPPAERGAFLKPDLVDLATLHPSVKLDIRYANGDDFLGVPVYTTARAFLQRPAAEALDRARAKLAEKGFGLLIHDGYRPWHVTKIFWDATPPRYRGFVADPARGSRHNRGCAIDLSLYDLKTGAPVDMPTGYDEFSRCAFADYPGVTRAQAANRAALRDALEAEGFLPIPTEWWHFDYKDWMKYPIQNVAFEDLPSAAAAFPDNGVTAHRGNSDEHPENTMPAFASGLESGADWIELDVFRTKDGKLVVIHDPTTGRVGDRDLPVKASTYEELRAVDVATDFRRRHGLTVEQCPPLAPPLLEDVLKLAMNQRRARVAIEPKMDCVADIVALVDSLGARAWVGVSDGNLDYLTRARRLAPDVPVFWTRPANFDADVEPTIARERGFAAMIINHKGVTPEAVAKIRAAGLSAGAWTVQDPGRMRELLGMGVDRIVTNRPRVLLEILRESRAD